MGPSSAPGDGAPVTARQAPHILVVEDDFLIRMMISEAFRDEGFTVVEAFNGALSNQRGRRGEGPVAALECPADPERFRPARSAGSTRPLR